MFYRVIKDFTDLQDDNHVYYAGDTFPREGVEVENARCLELSTEANKRGEVLIEVVEEAGDAVPEMAPEAEIQPEKDEIKTEEEPVDEVKKAPKTAKGKKEK